METVLYILPLLILVYYLCTHWPSLIKQPSILGLLIIGSLLLLGGIFAYEFIPKYASLARFSGTLLILIGIGIKLFKRNRINY